MTAYKLTFNPTFGPSYGITLLVLPGTKFTDEPSEFPQVNIGTNSESWITQISALFSNWAFMFHMPIGVHVEDDGTLSAWMIVE